MKHSAIRAARLGLALLALSALAACSFRDQGLAPLIPGDALGFVQINQPDTFLTNLDGFAAPLGLKDIVGNLTIRDLLGTGLKSAAGFDLSAIDLKKPIGLAVLPPPADSDEFGFILYVPLLKPEENGPKLEKLISASVKVTYAQANGYAIYVQGPADLKFPPAKPLKLPEHISFTPGTATLYGDFSAALTRYSGEWTKLKSDAEQEFESLDELSASDPGTAELAKRMIRAIFDGVGQMRSMSVELEPSAAGFRASSSLEFAPDGSVAALGKAVGTGKDLAAQSRWLNSGWLLNGALSGNAAAFKDMYLDWLKAYFDASKLSEADRTAILAIMEQGFALSGTNLAWACDLTLNPEALAAGPEALLNDLGSAFGFSVTMVQAINDPEGWKRYVAESMNSAAMKAYLDASMASTGLSLGFKLSNETLDGFAYQSLAFDLSVADPEKLSGVSDEERMGITAVAGIMSKFGMAMHAKDKLLYITMGDDAPAALKRLVEAGKAAKPLGEAPAWQAWLKTVPADSNYLGNLSVGRITDIASTVSGGSVSIDIPEADRSGISTWLRVRSNIIDSGMFWDIKEMQPVAAQAMQLAMNYFMGQALGGMEGEPDGYEGEGFEDYPEGYNPDGDWFEDEGDVGAGDETAEG